MNKSLATAITSLANVLIWASLFFSIAYCSVGVSEHEHETRRLKMQIEAQEEAQ